MKIIKRLTLIILCFLVVAWVYSIKIEPKMLIKKEIKLKNDINYNNGNVKIIQFSDVHLGDFFSLNQLEKVVKKINENEPDIVVFTGDLIDVASQYENINEISNVLSKIDAKLGKYAVYGNHDYGGGAVRVYENIMKESGFKVLVNENHSIKVSPNKNINILGVDDVLLGKPNIEKTVKNIRRNDYNILLSHEPDYVDKFKDYNIDLVLSGHSHGGQVYIPFYGPLKSTTYGEKYTRGLYNLNNQRDTKLYVNTGLGNTKLPIRLGNVPNISLFEIEY
ncbi:metallophosphoesterase [Clostridium frigidicarnis]|uniref:Calcineurin-like phosphoesterase domain-containing protein n=1 Tax=Clostridium frigidicarnis TaxID=84698 RepID=A0A1I0W4H7_9CLOT|nr:metallophosphoesterase [Clostridium frigidicarnis]SFA83238.1 hypothetical protein SAMN04488528_100411 [Clostridium frigidicarnis]